MTISEFTLKSSDLEPVRRFEIFTGSGRRREWSPEDKARIVTGVPPPRCPDFPDL